MYRKRQAAIMHRRVAVRYGFKRETCSKHLNSTWGADRIIPLNEAQDAQEAERLKSTSTLQPVPKAPQELRSSQESAAMMSTPDVWPTLESS